MHTTPSLRQRGNKQMVGILYALSAVMLFASFTVVSRMGLSSTALTLPDLAMLRFGVAGLILLPVLLRKGLGPLKWWQAASLAMTGGLGFALFAYTGFQLAPASHGGVLLHGTIPLFTFVMAWWITRSPPSTKGGAGLMLILAGVVTISFDSKDSATAYQWLGDVALLLAAICWAAYGLISQRLMLEPLHAVTIVATGSLVCFLPLYLITPATAIRDVPWPDVVLQGIFQGILIGIISGLLYTRAVASLGAQLTALFTAAVPCMTTVAAFWLLHENPSWQIWCGIFFVTLGMLASLFSRHPIKQ